MPRLREFFVGERQAVPIRAIPFATAMELTPEDIACAVVEVPDWEGRRFITVLTLHYLNAEGIPRPLPRFESEEWCRHVGALAKARADRVEQIRAMPPGWFVWQTELRGLVQEVNELLTARPPQGPGAAPIELTCSPMLTDTDANLVLEGFDVELFSSGPRAGPDMGDRANAGEQVGDAAVDAHLPPGDEAPTIPTRAWVERRLTPAQQDKRMCQILASRHWNRDGNLTQAAILRLPDVARYLRSYRDRKTVRGWIQEVDPRPRETRRGRRRRRQ